MGSKMTVETTQEGYDRLMAQMGHTARGRPTPQYKVNLIKDLLETDISMKQLCKTVHVTYRTVQRVRGW